MTSHGHGLMFHSAEKRAPKIEITEVTDEQSTLPPRKLVSALSSYSPPLPLPRLICTPHVHLLEPLGRS